MLAMISAAVRVATSSVAVRAVRLADLVLGSSTGPCRCGHARDAHEHYRPGTDCALCGVASGPPGAVVIGHCPRYRPIRRLRP